jgi:hypothetical protein
VAVSRIYQFANQVKMLGTPDFFDDMLLAVAPLQILNIVQPRPSIVEMRLASLSI